MSIDIDNKINHKDGYVIFESLRTFRSRWGMSEAKRNSAFFGAIDSNDRERMFAARDEL